MGTQRHSRKDLGGELKNHPGKMALQKILRGKLSTREMLRTLEHASKCRNCYEKLINETTKPRNPKKEVKRTWTYRQTTNNNAQQ